jgi:poly(A) polymerase Pap1
MTSYKPTIQTSIYVTLKLEIEHPQDVCGVDVGETVADYLQHCARYDDGRQTRLAYTEVLNVTDNSNTFFSPSQDEINAQEQEKEDRDAYYER